MVQHSDVVIKTYQQYLDEIGGKLDMFERASDEVSGTDERLDLQSSILLELARLFRAGLVLQLPTIPAPFPGHPPYNVRKYDLTTAKTIASPEEVNLPGDSLTFYSDGTLDGVQLAIESPTNDWIPVSEIGNPYRYPAQFKRFYLIWAAQTNKYLRVHIGREAGAEAALQVTAITSQTRTTFTHNQVSVGTTRVQLSSTSFSLWYGVTVKADDDNTSDIFVGGDTVTTATGYRLVAGQGITIEIDNVDKLYVIGGAAAQEVQYVGV